MALDNDNQLRLRQIVSLEHRLRDGNWQTPQRPADVTPVHVTPEAGTGPYSILIAEDNAINQKVIERMVQKLGYHVKLVANGREAIEALAASSYAAIFMDCQMPEMDGFEACRHIRQHMGQTNGATRIPIVAITANAMKGDRERCLAAGMDDYVSKPFTQENLRVVLERWLSPNNVANSRPAVRLE